MGLFQRAGKPRARTRRRAGAYILVLGAAMFVAIIGVSALTVAQLRTQRVTDAADAREAGILALAAIEHTLSDIETAASSGTPVWRSTFTSGVVHTNKTFGNGWFSCMLVDEADGDLANNNTDLVRLYGTGGVGDAQRIYSVLLQPYGAPLDSLLSALHGGGNVDLNNLLTVTGAPLSSNGNVNVGATLSGDLEAAKISGSGTVTGVTTVPAPAKAMPDRSVITMYRNLATEIPFAGDIVGQVLAPGYNPWGATNPDGVYYIDTLGNDLQIVGTRIHGTLIVNTRGGMLTLAASGLYHNYRSDYPTLIVDGHLELTLDSGAVQLTEIDWAANFNPTGAAYAGIEDTDLIDSYPNEIQGLVHVTGDLTLTGTDVHINGGAIVEGRIFVNGTATVVHDARLASNPPMGYSTGANVHPLTATWRRTASP